MEGKNDREMYLLWNAHGKSRRLSQGGTAKDWCVHCATANGALKSCEDALKGMTAFMTTSQGIAEKAAREVAKSYMKTMPAWKGIG